MKKKSLLLTAVAMLGLTAATMAQNVPSYVPTNGLVGWWPFNGNANDESGNGNNGVLNSGNNGTAVYSIDRNGVQSAALDLSSNPIWNSIGPYVEIIGTNTLNLNDYAINIWIKPNATCLTGELVNKGPDNVGFLSRIQAPLAGVAFGSTPQYVDYPFSVSTIQWTMLTFNRNISGNSELFINGSLVYTSSSSSPTNNNFNFAFGAMPSGGTNGSFYPYQGLFDDIGIWNRALTQQEITALYNGCQLTVSTQPNSQTININNNAQFIAGTSDPSANFQWQTDLGVGFQNLNSVGQYSGTTNDTLIVANVTLSNNNQPFRCIISSGSCSDTSNIAVLTVNNNVGINEFTQDNLFSVYPNPAQTVINVKADSKLICESYYVIDNTGRVVLTGKITSENTIIELGGLSNGVYMFNIANNMKQQFKILKH
jgi:hypothetical protein